MVLKNQTCVLMASIVVSVGAIYVWNRFFSAHTLSAHTLYLARCYLNDFLAGVMLYPIWYLVCALFLRSPEEKLFFKDRYIILCTLIAGFFWEYVTPFLRTDSVSDPLDIIAYLLGAIVFCFIRRLKIRLAK